MAEQLAQIFNDALSYDAPKRDAATAAITKARENPKEFLVVALDIFANHPAKEVRQQATVQIRNTILDSDFDVPSVKELLVKTVITCLHNKDFTDDLSHLVMPLCVRDEWPTAINDLIRVVQSSPDKRAIVEKVVAIIGDVMEISCNAFDVKSLALILEEVYNINPVVASTAFMQIVIGTNDEYRATWPDLSPFTPLLLKTLEQDTPDLTDVSNIVEKMIELCDVRGGSFFTPYAAEVMRVMTKIIQNRELDNEYRVFCASFLEYLITDRPLMCKEIKGLADTLVDACFEMMLDVSKEDVFDTQDNEYDAPPSSAGEALLDIISKSFDAHEIMPKVFAHIKVLIQSADWKHRRAAIVAIAQTVEFIPKESQRSTLQEMLPVVLNASKDENEVVRFSAAKCISQIAFDLAPLFQVRHKDQVLPVFVTLLSDSCTHVVLKTMKAFNNFSEGLTPTDLEQYLQPLMEKVVTVLNTTQDPDMMAGAFLMIGSAANSAKLKFLPIFDVVSPIALAQIQKADADTNVRSKALETLTIMCDATNNFPTHGTTLVQTILAIFQQGVKDDDPIHESAIYSLSRLVTVLEEASEPFLADVVMYFLPKLDVQPQVYQNFDESTLATIGAIVQSDGAYLTLTRGMCTEVKSVITLLISCITSCKMAYMPMLPKTVEALMMLLNGKFSVDFLEPILECVAVVVELLNTQPEHYDTIRSLVTKSIDVSMKFLDDTSKYHDPAEQYDEHVMEVQEELSNVSLTLAEVFKKCPTNVLPEEVVHSVAERSYRVMEMLQNVEKERFEKMARNAVDAEDRQRVDKDRELSSEYQQSIQSLTGGLMKSHPETFVNRAGNLTEVVIKHYLGQTEPGDFVIGAGCASNVIEYLREHGYSMWTLFIDKIITGCSMPDASVRHTCTYAIQQAASQFQLPENQPFTDQKVQAVVPHLVKCISMHDVESVDISYATDNAVSALFTILRMRHSVLGGPTESQRCAEIIFKHLPCVVDVVENVAICRALIECTNNKELAVLGENLENVGNIIAVLAKTYNTANSEPKLDEQITEMVGQFTRDQMLSFCAQIDEESAPYVERLFNDCSSTSAVQSP